MNTDLTRGMDAPRIDDRYPHLTPTNPGKTCKANLQVLPSMVPVSVVGSQAPTSHVHTRVDS
ncbi:MAG: hypothetical protein RL042_2239 [Nitrospirota bacterium]